MAWCLALVMAVILWLPPLARADETTVYRDEPEPLGGGGARIACGLIP